MKASVLLQALAALNVAKDALRPSVNKYSAVEVWSQVLDASIALRRHLEDEIPDLEVERETRQQSEA